MQGRIQCNYWIDERSRKLHHNHLALGALIVYLEAIVATQTES